MTISTNDAIRKFGTQTTVTAGGGTAAVSATAGTYSASSDAAAWTNTDDVPLASFVLTMQYPSGTITTGGIALMARLLNIDSTTDNPSLTANWTGAPLGSFVTGTGMSATTNYALSIGPVELPTTKSGQEYEFYLVNNCGVQITAGWTLKITPCTDGPK